MAYRVHLLANATAAVAVFVSFPSTFNGNLQTKGPLKSQKEISNSSAKFKVTHGIYTHCVLCLLPSFSLSFSQDSGHRLLWAHNQFTGEDKNPSNY